MKIPLLPVHIMFSKTIDSKLAKSKIESNKLVANLLHKNNVQARKLYQVVLKLKKYMK